MAASAELYTPVNIARVPSVPYVKQGVELPTEDLFDEQEIPDFSIIKLPDDIEEASQEDGLVSLVRVSPFHGRSFEIRFAGEKRVVWKDNNGILFSVITTKGNESATPEIVPQDNLSSGFMTFGLMDDSCLERVTKASKAIRGLGIEAEAIMRVMEPQQFYYLRQMVSQHLLTFYMLQSYIKTAIPDEAREMLETMHPTHNPPSRKKAFEYADKARYVIVVRAMQVSERLEDLKFAKTKTDLIALLRPAFEFTNFSEQEKAKEDPTYVPDIFNIRRPADRERFLLEYLPTKIGNVLGRLHNNGLAHNFATTGNISTVGSLCDLDSITGEILDGEKIGPEDKTEDIETFLDYSYRVIDDLAVNRVIGNSRLKIEVARLHQKFTRNFLNSYNHTAGRDGYFPLSIAASLHNNWEGANEFNAAGIMIDQLGVTHFPQIAYSLERDPNELIEGYYKKAEELLVERFQKLTAESRLSPNDFFQLLLYFTDHEFNPTVYLQEVITDDLLSMDDIRALLDDYDEESVNDYVRELAREEAARANQIYFARNLDVAVMGQPLFKSLSDRFTFAAAPSKIPEGAFSLKSA